MEPPTREQKYLKACATGDTAAIEYMISHNEFRKIKNFDHPDKFLDKCVNASCKAGDVHITKMLIQCQFDITGDKHEVLGKALKYACMAGDNQLIRTILDMFKDVKDMTDLNMSGIWNKCIVAACKNGNLHIVKLYIVRAWLNLAFISKCLSAACESGNLKLMGFIISFVDDDKLWNIGLIGACKGGHLNIVNVMIALGADDWKAGLYNACDRGRYEIAKFMISKGAANFDLCMVAACTNGCIKLVNLMIDNGATDFDKCMLAACSFGHLELAKLMIKHGATNFKKGLSNACHAGQFELAKLMINSGDANYEYDYKDAYIKNLSYGKSVSIFLLLDNIDSNVFSRELLSTYMSYRTMWSYRVHVMCCRYNKVVPIIDDKYMELLKEHPPYVLFIGCKAIGKSKNCPVKKIPVELFRLLFMYV